jgi:putative salt-induced outer membrane protein YdiY
MIVLACAVVAICPPCVGAEDRPEPWQPVAPAGMPTHFDWIRLPSDEWLKGEIVSMYDRNLEFDSEELGLLTLDWEDIKEVRSSSVVQVGFRKGEPAVGRLVVEGDMVRVVGESGEVEFARGEILTIIVGTPKEINYWSAYANVGGNIRSGNTDQVDYTARLGAMRRSLKNRIAFGYLGNITTIDDVDTSNNHLVTANWDRFVSERLFVFIADLEWYRDPFQNIANRSTLAAGVGYEIIDTSCTSWSVTAGPAYRVTEYESVAEGEDDAPGSLGLAISTDLGYELNGDIDFYLSYGAMFADEEAGTYTHHVDTGLDFELIGNLDFTVAWVWDRVQDPRPLEDGSLPEQDDYRITFGLGWDF